MASATDMIDLYSWATPFGRKRPIMLEEGVSACCAGPVYTGKGVPFALELARSRGPSAPATS